MSAITRITKMAAIVLPLSMQARFKPCEVRFDPYLISLKPYKVIEDVTFVIHIVIHNTYNTKF